MIIPMRELLTGVAMRASDVHRFAGVPVTHRESVAEHMWMAAFFAYAIAQQLESSGLDIDYGKLLRRAITHDLEEAVTGDITRNVKYWNNGAIKRSLDELGADLVLQIENALNGVLLAEHWADAKDASIEGCILATADFFCVSAYLLRELRYGNRHVLMEVDRHVQWLSKFRFEVLRAIALDEFAVYDPLAIMIQEVQAILLREVEGK